MSCGRALLCVSLCGLIVSAASRNFACTRLIVNQDGIGGSGFTCPNPIEATTNMILYDRWPNVSRGTEGFGGGVFDGKDIWLVPYDADSLVRFDPANGDMTMFNAWPFDLNLVANAFYGGAFDGSAVWLVPFGAKAVVSISPSSGLMTSYSSWPAQLNLGAQSFCGGGFDGTHLWLSPYNANGTILVNTATGSMSLLGAWPAALDLGAEGFCGVVYDGTNMWLVPYSSNSIVKIRADSGAMVLYNSWPQGLTRGVEAFVGGAFDGINIWLAPFGADSVVMINTQSGAMDIYNAWPPDLVPGDYKFAGAIFDGQSIWLIPDAANGLVKVTRESGNMSLYSSFPALLTRGDHGFNGGVFDGRNIWLVPYTADGVAGLISSNEPTVTITSGTLSSSASDGRLTMTQTESATASKSSSSNVTCSSSLSKSEFSNTPKSTASVQSESLSVTDSCGAASSMHFRFGSVREGSAVPLAVSLGEVVQSVKNGGEVDGSPRTTMAAALSAKHVLFTIYLLSPLSLDDDAGSAVTTTFGTVARVDVRHFRPPLWGNASVCINISVLMPPPNLVFVSVATTLSVVIPWKAFVLFPACGQLDLPLNGLYASLVLSPTKDRVVSDRVASAVVSAALTSGVASAIMGNPALAMQQSTILAMMELSACAFSDVERLSNGDSTFGYGFGDEVGRYYRGAIVIFLAAVGAVLLAFGVASFAIATVLYACGSRQGPFFVDLLDSSSAMHFPGIIVIPFVCFFQSALIASVSLIRLHESAADVVLASLAITVSVIGSTLALGVTVSSVWFRCEVQDRHTSSKPLPIEARIPCFRRLLTYVQWSQEWKDLPSARKWKFKRRFVNIFDGYRLPWFPAIEMICAGAQGIILGLRMNDTAMCMAQSVLLIIVSGASLVSVLLLRPAGSVFDHHCLVLGKVLVEISCFIVLLTSLGVEGLEHVEQWVSLAGTAIGNMQVIVAFLLVMLGAARFARQHGAAAFVSWWLGKREFPPVEERDEQDGRTQARLCGENVTSIMMNALREDRCGAPPRESLQVLDDFCELNSGENASELFCNARGALVQRRILLLLQAAAQPDVPQLERLRWLIEAAVVHQCGV